MSWITSSPVDGAPPDNKTQSNEEILIIEIFAEVYLVDRKIIRKISRTENVEDKKTIAREAEIYKLMEPHPRVAECLSVGITDYVEVRYYQNGDHTGYRKEKGLNPEFQSKLFRQIIEAVVAIHRHGWSDHPALGYEKASHCLPRDYDLPNTEMSDIFAMGSTLYELVVGKAPYAELWASDPEPRDPDGIRAQIYRQHQAGPEIEKRFSEGRFPDVPSVFCGDIILRCWKGDVSSAQEILDLYTRR
ncbi:hypothetical protein BDW69DRAFT_199708 [Aspergillus filifer]